MRRLATTFCFVVMATCVASPSWAQQLPQDERNVLDKKFWTVAIALSVSMTMDTKSTFDVFERCHRCSEADPYARPFVNRGPLVAFAAGAAFDIGVMYLVAKMKGSEHPVFRRIWWGIPVSMTVGHLAAYQHNLHVAR
jgi:hypothetical protein